MSDRVAREPELERCPEAPEDVPRRPRNRPYRTGYGRPLPHPQAGRRGTQHQHGPGYALLRRGELRAAKIGGRGDYRIGRDDLEAYIERTYAETERWIEEHPFSDNEE